MKNLKKLGLLAVAAAALMAFAGTSAAHELTSPAAKKVEKGKSILAASKEQTTFSGVANVTCQQSLFEFEITEDGGKSLPVGGPVSRLVFAECGENADLKVKKTGNLQVTTRFAEFDGDGKLWSAALEITIEFTALGLSCAYTTEKGGIATYLGWIRGSKSRPPENETATVTIEAELPRTGHSFFCGSTIEWKGAYLVETPDYLDVD